MDGWDVPLPLWDLQLFVSGPLIYNPILLQCVVHIQGLPVPLPSVAGCVVVNGLVSIQNLIDSLLRGHLQHILSPRQSIDDLDVPGAFGELADVIVLVLPPWDITVFRLVLSWVLWEIQVPPVGAVVLPEPLWGDVDLGLPCLLIEPLRDVSARRLDEGLHFFLGDVLLDVLCEIVDLSEEGYPYVVGSVVLLELGVVVVSALLEGFGDELLGFGHWISVIFIDNRRKNRIRESKSKGYYISE